MTDTLNKEDKARRYDEIIRTMPQLESRFDIPKDNECYWCGMTDTENEEDGYGPLTDFRVICADSEEGFADVTRYACNEHLIMLQEKFIILGFSNHKHGGINFLEDSQCPGFQNMHSCPTPDEEDD